MALRLNSPWVTEEASLFHMYEEMKPKSERRRCRQSMPPLDESKVNRYGHKQLYGLSANGLLKCPQRK